MILVHVQLFEKQGIFFQSCFHLFKNHSFNLIYIYPNCDDINNIYILIKNINIQYLYNYYFLNIILKVENFF